VSSLEIKFEICFLGTATFLTTIYIFAFDVDEALSSHAAFKCYVCCLSTCPLILG